MTVSWFLFDSVVILLNSIGRGHMYVLFCAVRMQCPKLRFTTVISHKKMEIQRRSY